MQKLIMLFLNIFADRKFKNASMNIDVEIEKENNAFKNLTFRFDPDSTNLSYVDLNFKIGLLKFNKKENISKHFSHLKPYQVHKAMFERIFNNMRMAIPGSHGIKATLTDVRIGKQNPLRVDFYTRFDNI